VTSQADLDYLIELMDATAGQSLINIRLGKLPPTTCPGAQPDAMVCYLWTPSVRRQRWTGTHCISK